MSFMSIAKRWRELFSVGSGALLEDRIALGPAREAAFGASR